MPLEVIVTSERAGFYKPRPEPYRLALTELGLDPIAYTYDWGMVTDLARRNVSRIWLEPLSRADAERMLDEIKVQNREP